MSRWMLPFLLLMLAPAQAPGADLFEGNAKDWVSFAEENAPSSVSDSTTMTRCGQYSLKFSTQSGFATGIRYPKTGAAHWNLTTKKALNFWSYPINNNAYGFQGDQPIIKLTTAGGSVTYTYQGTPVSKAWNMHVMPLAGSSSWVRTTTGSPDLADVLSIEIQQDTWGYGFDVYYDGLEWVDNGEPPSGPTPPAGVNPNAMAPKVFVYIFNPIIEARGGKRLTEVYGWSNPEDLVDQAVVFFNKASHGLVNYQVVEKVVADLHPYYVDRGPMTDEEFIQRWEQRDFPTNRFDYLRFIRENGLVQKAEQGKIDEVWIWGTPFFGGDESDLAGNGAYWVNGAIPAVECQRMFPIFFMNYENPNHPHNFGHFAENVMSHSYGPWKTDQTNNWNRFTLYDKVAPGKAAIGNVHFPANAVSDYDYANATLVWSEADDWLNYPNFKGTRRQINCHEWSPTGADPHNEYLMWFYQHMPHVSGRGPDGFLCNWWRYLIDTNQFKGWNGNLTGTSGQPSITNVSLRDGSAVQGKVEITVDASAMGALGRVDMYVDGVYTASDALWPFTFEWDATALRGQHNVEFRAYELQRGTESRATPVHVLVTDIYQSQICTGLLDYLLGRTSNKTGLDYNQDAAINVADLVGVMVAQQPAAPSVPVPASGAQISTTSVTLKWNACLKAQAYDLLVWEYAHPSIIKASLSGLTTPQATLNGLAPKTRYDWKVTARNPVTRNSGPNWYFTIP